MSIYIHIYVHTDDANIYVYVCTYVVQLQRQRYLHCIEFPLCSLFMKIRQAGIATTITIRDTAPTTAPIIFPTPYGSELPMYQKGGFIYS